MTRANLDRVIDWAAADGWTPGLSDAEAFHAADPAGSLMGWLGETPVTAISVVRHSERFGFLGFYLCVPEYRGQGHGWATWQAGLAHLGARTIGLDGVAAQQGAYRRSGFAMAHQTQRYGGRVAPRADPACAVARPEDLPELLALDRRIGGGVARERCLGAWFRSTPWRVTLVRREVALGTSWACHQGHKIGPLLAPDAASARTMIQALVAEADADAEEVFIDSPDANPTAVALVAELDLTSAFACPRMYKGTAPPRDLARIFGEASFELG
ncbi:MAG: GNAT family N-acetyltransferase [Pseudomonadota bacterium]